ncbi:hypothetical protein CJD38_09570 [Stenotrophobium rhamnosiphilum]|uniref:cyclic-guanylate-specific phosphodiesterase n=2 Tax=Stenotrophobium rhamnosiphilum TaxID=2029166 RepID=A0A2T5MG74_9GAMM|nr:hypothetical protein CJD38_09570 [Stenotrophobium rhamnosiphilum]
MLFDSPISFIPHGYCLSWSPMLVGLLAGSHLLIGLSYLSIPVALFFFARRHPELNQKLLFTLFTLFILGCGATHLIELVNIWVPFYRLDTFVLAGTALVSVVTAVLIWPITRQATQALHDVFQARREQAITTDELFETVMQLKQVNLKLDESERRFRMSVEYAPNGQATVDLNGRWLIVNQSLCKMLGYGEAELLQKTFQEITHPDDIERDLEHVKNLLAGRQVSYRMEKRYFCKSGAILHAQLDVALLRSPLGAPLHFIVQIQDISERINATIATENAERRFRRMIEDVKDYAIINLDINGLVSSWNEGARHIKGYQAHEIIGRHFSCFHQVEDIANNRPNAALKMAEENGHFQEEGLRIRKDGSVFWASVLITAIHDTDGTLLGYSKITRDLTERRHAEEVIAQANGLREAIMHAAPCSIIATDPDGVITSINPAAERMLWYASEDLVGKQTTMIIHDEHEVAARSKELSAKYKKKIETGFEAFVYEAREDVVEEHEWTYIRKNGSRLSVQLAVSALRDSNQKIIGFLSIAYDITQRKYREEYTRHVALHDDLTGLPNRALLKDRINVAIESAKRNHKKVGVMMLDLDHFKRINDTLGHHVGDELLKVVADRLVKALRKSDTAARMGGDEFVVVTPDMSDDKNADFIANTLVKAISAPIKIGMHELIVTPSIGVSCFPDDGEEANTLIKYADAAMYQTKASGRHGHQHFNAAAQAIVQRKLAMEADLRLAIAKNHLQVYYQPQVCLSTGKIIGVEALARWIDPVKGMISPELFIPVAEESGLIIELGNFVLRTACRDARILQERVGHPMIMAVNLSARQFRQETLVDTVSSIIAEARMDPAMLELEITEGVMMENDEKTRSRMQGLRDLGISLAVDDFGTGYSSLSYLTQFPITTLKIDRSFVDKINEGERDAAVVQAIIAMAYSLKTKVIAEGVETVEQLEFLQEHTCSAAQGFMFSKPMSMAELGQAFDQIQKSSTDSVMTSLHKVIARAA